MIPVNIIDKTYFETYPIDLLLDQYSGESVLNGLITIPQVPKDISKTSEP
jgi:hypothetical protein